MAKVKINFDNDIKNIFEQDKDFIYYNTSGHYFIPISHTNKGIKNIDKINSTEYILLNITNMSSKSKEEK